MSTPAPHPRRRTSLRSPAVPYPTLDYLKALLGIDSSDTSQDEAIAAMLAACLAMIENYCGRVFEEGDYTEEFAPIDARNPFLMLRAWPIQSVESVTRDGVALTGWRFYAQSGMLLQYQHLYCWCHSWYWTQRVADVIVEYVGGYPPDQWPADLVDILTRLFMARWNATGGTGNPADETTSQGAGAIKGFNVDAVRIDYDVGDKNAAAGDQVAAGTCPPELAPFAAALQPYVDIRVYGV